MHCWQFDAEASANSGQGASQASELMVEDMHIGTLNMDQQVFLPFLLLQPSLLGEDAKKSKQKVQLSWLWQAWLRQTPTVNGPQYPVGHHGRNADAQACHEDAHPGAGHTAMKHPYGAHQTAGVTSVVLPSSARHESRKLHVLLQQETRRCTSVSPAWINCLGHLAYCQHLIAWLATHINPMSQLTDLR